MNKIHGAVLGATMLLSGTGCSEVGAMLEASPRELTEIDWCVRNGTNVVATSNVDAADYSPSTDPFILAEQIAREVKSDETGQEAIGLGAVACNMPTKHLDSGDGPFLQVLTIRGVRASRRLDPNLRSEREDSIDE